MGAFITNVPLLNNIIKKLLTNIAIQTILINIFKKFN